MVVHTTLLIIPFGHESGLKTFNIAIWSPLIPICFKQYVYQVDENIETKSHFPSMHQIPFPLQHAIVDPKLLECRRLVQEYPRLQKKLAKDVRYYRIICNQEMILVESNLFWNMFEFE